MNQERRRMPRYRIDVAIAVDQDGTGRTIDLSSNSVFFETVRQLAPGEQVALVFPFQFSGPGNCVNCTAQVVRVEPRGRQFGVAATYEPVSFSVSA